MMSGAGYRDEPLPATLHASQVFVSQNSLMSSRSAFIPLLFRDIQTPTRLSSQLHMHQVFRCFGVVKNVPRIFF